MVHPSAARQYNELYETWKERLNEQLKNIDQAKTLSFSLS
jgi:hypothetical protein